MKMRQLKLITIMCLGLASFAMYQLFFIMGQDGQLQVSSVGQVHEASRVNHAKELLGASYTGSAAQKAEGKNSLNKLVQNKVFNSLSPRWKHHSRKISQAVIAESARKKMDPFFVLAVIKTESKFNPHARGLHGEVGLMQIKPSTAEWIAKKYNLTWNGPKTLNNPVLNIRIGIAYMDYLRSKFNKKALKYISAYNVGPKKAHKIFRNSEQSYSARVFSNYLQMYNSPTRIARN